MSSCQPQDPIIAYRTGKEGQAFPSFTEELMDSTQYISFASIVNHSNLVIFYDPECPFCNVQVKDMIKHMNWFRKVNICLLTTAQWGDMKKFSDRYQLQQYANMMLVRDTGAGLQKYYHLPCYPTTMKVDGDGKMQLAVTNMINAKTIRRLIQY